MPGSTGFRRDVEADHRGGGRRGVIGGRGYGRGDGGINSAICGKIENIPKMAPFAVNFGLGGDSAICGKILFDHILTEIYFSIVSKLT